MSQQNDTGYKAFTAGAAIGQHLRVKLTSGKLALAGVGASDEGVELGQMRDASFNDLDVRTVVLRTKPGTAKMVAAGAIAQGAEVYGAASGKISTTSSGNVIGVALEAAAADLDVIEVLRR